ncbi:MAG: ABC transporter substrate-binding protein [Haloarculaceae archaeon]
MVNDGNGAVGGHEHGSRTHGDGNNGNGSRVRRRRFLQATGAGAAALGVAGCLNQSDGGGQTEGIPDTIELGVLTRAKAKDPIGVSIMNGAKLAVKELNDNGGIDGSNVNLTVESTEEDPGTGRTKYKKLTDSVGVHATMGVFTSEVLLGIMDSIAQAKTVHMTSGAATPEASNMVHDQYDKYKYHFRTGPINGHHLGVNMVDFLDAKSSDLGWDSVAVLVENYKWTEPVQAVLEDTLSSAGVDVTMTKRYASDTDNFSPIYNSVENSGADAAYVAMAHTGTAALKQWASNQRNFEFGGIHVPAQLPSYYDLLGGLPRYTVVQNSATPTTAITDKTKPFASNYKQAYGSYPVYTGYITYDAVKQWASVVKDKGTVNADEIVSGLEESAYTGTAGTISYYGKDKEYAHDVIYDQDKVNPVWHQWQKDGESGKQAVVYPDDLAEATYKKPSWI